MDMLKFSMASASGWEYFGKKFRTNMLKFSLSRRWDSVAIVSNTMDDLPEPETPVKMVILRLGIRNETFFKLFSRAPRISMYSCGMNSPLISLPITKEIGGQKPGFHPPRTVTTDDEAVP